MLLLNTPFRGISISIVEILSLHSTLEDAKLMSKLIPDRNLLAAEVDSELTQEQRFKRHREFAFYAHPRFHPYPDPPGKIPIYFLIEIRCVADMGYDQNMNLRIKTS